MDLAQERIYTIDDIYALPSGQRAELIDGQMHMMAPPNFRHQKLVMELSAVIHQYIKNHGGNCEVLPAPFAVFLNADDKTYVEPDISVICDRNKLSDQGCNGAPDLIIEVVSPGSRRMDYVKKTGLYADAGVREYWIVDPEKQRTTIYQYEEYEAPTVVPFDQLIAVGIYEDLTITISDLLS